MYVVCVTVWVKPGTERDFIQATLENSSQTRNEPGNVRFDVLQAEQDPSQFFLYEVYRTKPDFEAHQKTSHYLKWREAVADMMAKGRQGVRYNSLFPPAEGW